MLNDGANTDMYYRNEIEADNLTEPEGTTSPYGLWRYGNDYHNASVTLLKCHTEHAFVPFYSNLGQSIELSLKSFLAAKGYDPESLRKKYGHKLLELFLKAIDENINSLVDIKTGNFAPLEILSMEYGGSKRFHYIKTGTMFLPRSDLLIQASYDLTRGLQQFCFDKTKWEKSK